MIGAALSTSARSLRTTRSLGSLRAAVATPSAAVPPLPSRSLVSTVLLTRETYEKRNVAQLKDECKQRGLTTSGRRADIVARLLNDDARQNGSGIREEPAVAAKAHRRTNSSLASLRGSDAPAKSQASSPSSSSSSSSSSKNAAPPKKTAASPPSSNASTLADSPTARSPVDDGHTVTTGSGASIPTPEDIRPGQVAHAGQPLGQGQPAISSTEKLDASSNPPGVPPQKEPSHHPTTFKVEVPTESVPEKHGPEIPIVTMYTRREAEPAAAPRGPKLMTAASETSDVVSHAFDDAARQASNELPGSAAQAIDSATRSLKADAGLKGQTLGPQISSVLKGTGLAGVGQKVSEATSAMASDAMSAFQNVKQGAAQMASSTASSGAGAGAGAGAGSAKRPLNADEKRGVYALGALLFGGFFAGSLGAPSKKKDQH